MSGGETVTAAPQQGSWTLTLARLWCLRRVDAAPPGSRAAIASLAAAWLAAWAAIDLWQRQPDPEFSPDGIPVLAWYVLGIIGLSGVLRLRSALAPDAKSAMVLALALAPFPLLLMSVLVYLLDSPWIWWLAGAVSIYGFLFLSRGLRALTGRPQRAAALLGTAFVAGFVYLSDATNAIPDLWNPREPPAATDSERVADQETVLFEQADRIDKKLETVQRDASARPQAFFLGFAGVGDEKVFAQEVGLASRVLGERFGVGDRHVSLINDERDLDRAPIASVSGLRYALQGIASRMDRDRDVLFLAISSHGAKDAVIAVSNSQLPLQDLTGEDLAGALKDSGIKWRVIVISACYAGAFVDVLRDPDSIVITAAAADRTSFGCSVDSDLTYFGEAFYRDALPEAPSLRQAFETARAAIAERERNEQVTPSNPQAFYGAEMEKRLALLAR